MRKLIISLLLFFAATVQAQNFRYTFPDSISISFFEDYQRIDTLGFKIITAYGTNHVRNIMYIPNSGNYQVNIEDQKDLLGLYKGHQQGLINKLKGQVISSTIIEKNGLKLSKFSFKTFQDGEQQIRHYLVLFVNGGTYSFSFWELETMTTVMQEEREQYFSSLHIPSRFTATDQLRPVFEQSRAYKMGYLFGQLIVFVAIVVGIIVFIKWLSSRKKKNSN